MLHLFERSFLYPGSIRPLFFTAGRELDRSILMTVLRCEALCRGEAVDPSQQIKPRLMLSLSFVYRLFHIWTIRNSEQEIRRRN